MILTNSCFIQWNNKLEIEKIDVKPNDFFDSLNLVKPYLSQPFSEYFYYLGGPNFIQGQHSIIKNNSALLVEVQENSATILLLPNASNTAPKEESNTQNNQQFHFLQATQKIAKISSWRFNIKTQTFQFTDSLYNLLEATEAELKQNASVSDFLKFVARPHRNLARFNILQMIMHKRLIDFEIKIYTFKNNPKWLKFTCGWFLDDESIIGVAQDITESKLIQKEIESKNEILSLAQNVSNTSSFIWNTKTNDFEVSDNWYDIFELDRKRANKSNLIRATIKYADNPNELSDYLTKYARKNDVWEIQFAVTTPNGNKKMVKAYGNRYFQENTKLGVIQDITDITLAQAKYKDQLIRFNSVIDSVGELIYALDCNWNIIFLNKAIKEFISKVYAITLNVGDNFKGLKLSQYSFFNSHVKGWEKAFSGGSSSNSFLQQTKGNDFWWEFQINPLTFNNIAAGVLTAVNVTEVKKLNSLLIESEIRFELAVNGARVGIWDSFIKKDGNDFWNPILYEFLGVDSHKIKPSFTNFLEFTHPNDIQLVQETIDCHLKNKTPLEAEIRVFNNLKKQYFWYRLEGKAIRDQYNDPYRISGTITDINSRKLAELEIIEREKQHQLVLEANSAGIYVLDINKGIYQNSKRANEILGYQQNHQEEASFMQNLIHPDDQPKFQKILQEYSTRERQTHTLEYRMKHSNGHFIWILDTAIAVFENDKLKQVIGSVSDITARKIAQQKLFENELKFTNIFNNSLQFNAILHPGGGILEINSTFAKAINQKQKDVFRFKIFDLKGFTEKSRIKLFQALESAVSGNVEEFEVILNTENQNFYLNASYKPIFGVNNEIINLLFEARDVSKIKEVQLDLEQTAEILSTQNSKLENFAHITSHNLRAPASNILMLIEMYKNAESTEEKEWVIDKLEKSGSRILSTIDVLANSLRISKNTNKQLVEVPIQKVLINVLDYLLVPIQESQALIDHKLKVKEVVYVESYLESILFNLISNAIKYKSPEKQLKITICSKEDGNFITISVSDNGLGIDMDRQRDKLFGLYNTFHNNEDARGVGLFLTKTQVEALGGKIYVKSKVNFGTTFTFSIPKQ